MGRAVTWRVEGGTAMEQEREWQKVPMWLLVASGVVRPADSARPFIVMAREAGEADETATPAAKGESVPTGWWTRVFHRQPAA
ncbi:MAG TPA: hypothetical protein VLA99_05560 [Nitrospiraceae bacterium]|nr:hypothetical protein [Nitrospiraceae bacterium]